jgi:hypothetical protein
LLEAGPSFPPSSSKAFDWRRFLSVYFQVAGINMLALCALGNWAYFSLQVGDKTAFI